MIYYAVYWDDISILYRIPKWKYHIYNEYNYKHDEKMIEWINIYDQKSKSAN